jgi:MFS transporter, ACS family, tartrate transporter
VLGKVEYLTGSFVGGLYYLCCSMLVAATILFFVGLGKKKV